MSAKQFSRKNSITIAVVMAMLVGVVFLNVDTFGGKGGKTSRGYRLQAHPAVPMDAGRPAGYEAGLTDSVHNRGSKISTSRLKRDPFFPGQAQPKPMPMPKSKHRKRPAATAAPVKPLVCSAIMLGGKAPMAIINGEGRHPGEMVRGMVLDAIDADGVIFRKSDGSAFHLAVGVKENKNSSFRVVTRIPKTEDQGRTRLADQYKEGNPK